MSDEPVKLLKQILEVQREHFEFVKQHHEEFAEMQQLALRRQKSALLLSRLAMGGLLLAVALLAMMYLLPSLADREEKPTVHYGPAKQASPDAEPGAERR